MGEIKIMVNKMPTKGADCPFSHRVGYPYPHLCNLLRTETQSCTCDLDIGYPCNFLCALSENESSNKPFEE